MQSASFLVNYCIVKPNYWGWLGDLKVLGKLSVPVRRANLDNARARAYCSCSRCGWGVWIVFLTSVFSFFCLPLRETA